LEANHFIKFKSIADDQIEKNTKKEEESRFNQAVAPIDQALEQLGAELQNKDPLKDGPEGNHQASSVSQNRSSLSDYSETPLMGNSSYLKSQFGPN
jgi:hypothetical protein